MSFDFNLDASTPRNRSRRRVLFGDHCATDSMADSVSSPNGGSKGDLRNEFANMRVGGLERFDSSASSLGGMSPGHSQRGPHRSHRTEPFLIGVAGGTASGKTTVCDQIVQRLNGTSWAFACMPQRRSLTLTRTTVFVLLRRSMCCHVGPRFFLSRSYCRRENRRQK